MFHWKSVIFFQFRFAQQEYLDTKDYSTLRLYFFCLLRWTLLCILLPLLIFFPLYLFLQLENIGNFVRAIVDYGLKPHDIFEANDLFENVNHTQVQSTLIALAGMVRVSSFIIPDHSAPSYFFCISSKLSVTTV